METIENESKASSPERRRISQRPLPHRSPSTAFEEITSNRKVIEESNNLSRDRSNLLHNVTIDIVPTYKQCNPNFKAVEVLPQRILTNPSEGVLNNGLDNADGNLICRVHDKLIHNNKIYTILDLVGTGTFGQVFRCKRDDTKELVAVKVIKNKPAYHNQGMLEIKIAKLLNANYDPNNEKHIVRLMETFEYQGHICLVFELLGMSLLDLLTQNTFRGLPLSVVQRFTKQILTALIALEDANIIHCDLKPENILVIPPSYKGGKNSTSNSSSGGNNGTTSTESINNSTANLHAQRRGSGVNSDVKVIDFGSACFEGQTIYSYIQSRFYRSPEVLLGAPYTGAIDMWSLACVCAEMYLGLPLFPGVSQHNQLARIVEMLGVPPDFLIECKNGLKYFTPVTPPTTSSSTGNTANPDSTSIRSSLLPRTTSNTAPKYRIKTAEEYALETNTEVPVLKKYLRYTQLDEVIMKCTLPNKSKMTQDQKNAELLRRRCFVDFLQGLFRLNPFERWTAKQAIEHPFIKGTPFLGSFQPSPDKEGERKFMFLIQMQRRQQSIPVSLSNNTSNNATAEDVKQTLRAQRAPTNFGSSLSGAQPNFTPLQYAHRRLSDPIDSATSSAKAAFFENNDRPLLKRGDPVHMKSTPVPVPTKDEAETKSLNSNDSEAKDNTANGVKESATTKNRIQTTPSDVPSPTKEAAATNTKSETRESPTPPFRSSDASDKDEFTPIVRVDQKVPKPNPSMSKNKPRHMSFTSGTTSSNVTSTSGSTNIPLLAQQAQQALERKRSNSIRTSLGGQSNQNNSNNNQPSWHVPPPPYVGSGPLPGPPHQMIGHFDGQYPGGNNQFMFPPPPGQWPMNMPPPTSVNPMMPPPPMMPPNPGSYYGSSVDQYYPQMASSFGPSSYGVFAGGSMQEGHMFITDFGMALLRPDMDEQRRLHSQTNPGPMWPPTGPPMTMDPMYLPPPPQMHMPPYGYNAAGNHPMAMGGGGSMPMAMSYDSQMLPNRMAANRMPYDNINRNSNRNMQQPPQQQLRSPKKPDDQNLPMKAYSQDYAESPSQRQQHLYSHQSSSATTMESSYQSRHADEMMRGGRKPSHHQPQGDGDSDEATDSPSSHSHKSAGNNPMYAQLSPPKINREAVARSMSSGSTKGKSVQSPSTAKGRKGSDAALADTELLFELED